MKVLFCCDPLDNKSVDVDWSHEYEMAQHFGMDVILLDYDTFKATHLATSIKVFEKPVHVQTVLYRGWMMPIDLYDKLYQVLLTLNLRLINSPKEYEFCYYLPRSYELIKNKTADSVFYPQCAMPNDDKIISLLSTFKDKSIIVKDFVKSQKHYWNEACFIPDASDTLQAKKIINAFIKKQADNFQGGLVFREFIDLEPIGSHTKSNMPLTKEYRIFVLNKKPIISTEYWENGLYDSDEKIDIKSFNDIFNATLSNFFTVDIAKKKNGEWIIIELGDGQVAEYFGNTGLNTFYKAISEME